MFPGFAIDDIGDSIAGYREAGTDEGSRDTVLVVKDSNLGNLGFIKFSGFNEATFRGEWGFHGVVAIRILLVRL